MVSRPQSAASPSAWTFRNYLAKLECGRHKPGREAGMRHPDSSQQDTAQLSCAAFDFTVLSNFWSFRSISRGMLWVLKCKLPLPSPAASSALSMCKTGPFFSPCFGNVFHKLSGQGQCYGRSGGRIQHSSQPPPPELIPLKSLRGGTNQKFILNVRGIREEWMRGIWK